MAALREKPEREVWNTQEVHVLQLAHYIDVRTNVPKRSKCTEVYKMYTILDIRIRYAVER